MGQPVYMYYKLFETNQIDHQFSA